MCSPSRCRRAPFLTAPRSPFHTGAAFTPPAQGLANRKSAALYLEYPTDWAYGYTASVREWVASSRGSAYTPLASLADALAAFRAVPKGYVLWDPHGTTSARGTYNSARQSLLVALTAAGQLGGIVATEAQVPMLEALGLPRLADYSSLLRNMSDAQAMAWAKQRLWAGATKDELMWMGGECGTQVRPAQADVGVMRGLFFTDLSTLQTPQWVEENALADELIAEAADACEAAGGNPLIVLGWHSYARTHAPSRAQALPTALPPWLAGTARTTSIHSSRWRRATAHATTA